MNIIRLCGGLGNQLFQYAFGQAQKHNGIEVKYDTSWYLQPRDPARPYLLNKFNTQVITHNRKRSPVYLVKKKEKGFDRRNIILDNLYFLGYWQSPSIFFESASLFHVLALNA